MTGKGARRSEDGQVAVSFVATLPFVLLALIVAAQLALAGQTAFSAATSARAGARAAHVGDDAEGQALDALPASLRGQAEVESDSEVVRVTVEIPRLIPGLPRLPLTIGAGLGPEELD